MAEIEQNLFVSLVYEAVSEIPRGKVATYGQIATLIGLPRHARHVGKALAKLPWGSEVPWYRVVNAKGFPYATHAGESSKQRQLLMAEGIQFNEAGNINLKKYQWCEGRH